MNTEDAGRVAFTLKKAKIRIYRRYTHFYHYYIPTWAHMIYREIDREVIVLTYGLLVVILPGILSATGRLYFGMATAILGLALARVLRYGRRKRREERIVDEAASEAAKRVRERRL